MVLPLLSRRWWLLLLIALKQHESKTAAIICVKFFFSKNDELFSTAATDVSDSTNKGNILLECVHLKQIYSRLFSLRQWYLHLVGLELSDANCPTRHLCGWQLSKYKRELTYGSGFSRVLFCLGGLFTRHTLHKMGNQGIDQKNF